MKYKNQMRLVAINGTYPKDGVIVHEVKAASVSFCRLGGGFVTTLTIDQMNETFRIATDEELVEKYSAGIFELDDTPQFKGYTTGIRWNGWATPLFTLEVAKSIVSSVNGFEGWVTYDSEKDQFIIQWGEDEPEIIDPITIVVDGESKIVYGIGTGSWTWNEATKSATK